MEWNLEPIEAMARFLYLDANPGQDWFKLSNSTRFHWIKVAANAWEIYWLYCEHREAPRDTP